MACVHKYVTVRVIEKVITIIAAVTQFNSRVSQHDGWPYKYNTSSITVGPRKNRASIELLDESVSLPTSERQLRTDI